MKNIVVILFFILAAEGNIAGQRPVKSFFTIIKASKEPESILVAAQALQKGVFVPATENCLRHPTWISPEGGHTPSNQDLTSSNTKVLKAASNRVRKQRELNPSSKKTKPTQNVIEEIYQKIISNKEMTSEEIKAMKQTLIKYDNTNGLYDAEEIKTLHLYLEIADRVF